MAGNREGAGLSIIGWCQRSGVLTWVMTGGEGGEKVTLEEYDDIQTMGVDLLNVQPPALYKRNISLETLTDKTSRSRADGQNAEAPQ